MPTRDTPEWPFLSVIRSQDPRVLARQSSIGVEHPCAGRTHLASATTRWRPFQPAPTPCTRRTNARPMATADLTVLTLGRPIRARASTSPRSSATFSSRTACASRCTRWARRWRARVADILAIVGELHAIPFEHGAPRVYTGSSSTSGATSRARRWPTRSRRSRRGSRPTRARPPADPVDPADPARTMRSWPAIPRRATANAAASASSTRPSSRSPTAVLTA